MIEQLVTTGVANGAGYALMALSLGLVYRLTGELHLEFGGYFLLGGYAAVCPPWLLNDPSPVVYGTGLFFVLLLSTGFERLVFTPLRRHRTDPQVILIVALGLLICFQNACALAFGPNPLSVAWLRSLESVTIASVSITIPQIVIVCTATLLLAVITFILEFTRFGTQWRAVANDSELALTLGIPTQRIRLFSVLSCSVIAYIAGFLLAADTAASPSAGFTIVLFAIVAIFVGGVKRTAGPLLGGLFLGVVQNLGIWKLPSMWKDAIAFFVLITFILLRSQDLLQRSSRRPAG